MSAPSSTAWARVDPLGEALHLLQAATRLREEAVSVGELAGGLGYESEASFSRAFKRLVGVAPGALRKEQGTPAALHDRRGAGARS